MNDVITDENQVSCLLGHYILVSERHIEFTNKRSFMALKYLSMVLGFLLFIFSVFPAVAQEQIEETCKPVAVLFGEKICLSRIEPDPVHIEAMKEQYKTQDLDPDDGLGKRNRQQLKSILWEKALEHKFGAEAIKPTVEEVLKYAEAFKGAMVSSYEADKKTLSLINELLVKNNYSPENMEEINNILRVTEMSVNFYEQRQKQKESMPEEYRFMAEKAEYQVAEAMVQDWKINKLLYDAYGGKIIFQQAGLEPLEAYADFLKYIKEDGELKILNAAYQDTFGEMDQYLAMGHNVLPDNEKDMYGNYFSTPYWQFQLSNNMERFEDVKSWLLSLSVIDQESSE